MLVSIFVHKDRLPYVKEALNHHKDDLVIGELTESDNHKVEFDLSDLDVQLIFHAGIEYGLDRMLGKEKTEPVA